jgi:ABC-type glycerol-3-phosphate transport system substrate-binding protein
MGQGLSRRTVLKAALASVAMPAVGCSVLRVGPTKTDTTPTLVIGPLPIVGWEEAISHAWPARDMGFRLDFSVEQSRCPPMDVALVQESALLGLERADSEITAGFLSSLMRSADFDPSAIWPALLAEYQDPRGNIAALPIYVGEIQFYVNSLRLKELGIQDEEQWAWEDLETAITLAAANSKSGVAPLIVGEGWGNVRFWGALIEGLGGNLFGQNGTPDFLSTATETASVVSLARVARWNPAPTFYDGSPEADFLKVGFGGAAGNALFAFAQPWTIDHKVFPGPNRPPVDITAACIANGVCSLRPRGFPKMPQKAVIPASDGWGLVPDPRTSLTDQAMRFLNWLYKPAQQDLVMPLGVPPVIMNQDVQGRWNALQSSPSWSKPLFQGGPYLDVLPQFPEGQTRTWAMWPPGSNAASFVSLCSEMYQGQTVEQVLSAAQQAVHSSAPPGPALVQKASDDYTCAK